MKEAIEQIQKQLAELKAASQKEVEDAPSPRNSSANMARS